MKKIQDFQKVRTLAIKTARQMSEGSSLNIVRYLVFDTRRTTPPEICTDYVDALRIAGINGLSSVPDHSYIFAIHKQSGTEINIKYCLPLPEGIESTEVNYTLNIKFKRDLQTYLSAKQKAVDYFINEVSESITDEIKTYIVLRYPEMQPKAVAEYETALKLAGITDSNPGTGYVFHVIANGTKTIFIEYVNPHTNDVPAWATAGRIFANVRGLGKLLRSRSTNQPIKTL